MLVLRPAAPADAPRIEPIARRAATGTALPRERAALEARIAVSLAAFSAEVDVPGEEQYLFVMEDAATGAIAGVSGLTASAGHRDRFYSYRREIIVHASQQLKVFNRIQALHLCHDLTGASLLTSFCIDPAIASTPWPQLLSRGRLLFVAEHRRRFAPRLAAEHPGAVDARGASPFWDAVGRRFFSMDFPTADQLASGASRTFIAELMPQYPIYVPLLPPEAQQAIGQCHTDAVLPRAILRAEGFEEGTYVDIFDGGPTLVSPVSALATVRHQHLLVLGDASPGGDAAEMLIATVQREGFRATIAPARREGSTLAVHAATRRALGITAGAAVRAVPLVLNPENGEGAC